MEIKLQPDQMVENDSDDNLIYFVDSGSLEEYRQIKHAKN